MNAWEGVKAALAKDEVRVVAEAAGGWTKDETQGNVHLHYAVHDAAGTRQPEAAGSLASEFLTDQCNPKSHECVFDRNNAVDERTRARIDVDDATPQRDNALLDRNDAIRGRTDAPIDVVNAIEERNNTLSDRNNGPFDRNNAFRGRINGV